MKKDSHIRNNDVISADVCYGVRIFRTRAALSIEATDHHDDDDDNEYNSTQYSADYDDKLSIGLSNRSTRTI